MFKQKLSAKLSALLILLSIASGVILNISPASRASAVTQYGGTLTVGVGATYPGFCVGNNPGIELLHSYRTMYETLVERDADGVLRPFLAESVTANADNTVWTIRLRSGISYHDGDSFDATNVKLNLDANRGVLSTSRSKYYLLSAGVSNLANVLTVSVIDTRTVQVDLELPQIDFLETLYAEGRLFMRSTTQLSSASVCTGSPNGTGPFKLSSFTWEALSVVRNDDYWRSDKSGNNLPYLDGLSFVGDRDSDSRRTSLQDHTYDAAFFGSISESSSIKELRLDRTNFRETDSQTNVSETLFLNAGKIGSPLRSLNARMALAAAIDTTQYHEDRIGGLGEIPSALFPARSIMHTSEGRIPYDLAQAKMYKARYVVEGGSGPAAGASFRITIPADTSSISIASADFLSDAWRRAGISTTRSVEESALIVQKMFDPSESGASQNFYDLVKISDYLSSYSSSYNAVLLRDNAFNPGTSNNIDSVVGGPVMNTIGTVYNLSHHEDTSVDTQLLDARAQLTRKSAAAKFRSAIAYYQSQVYAIPLVSGFIALFANRQIDGISNNYLPSGEQAMTMGFGGPDWSTVYLKGTQTPVRNLGTATETQSVGWVGAQPKGLALISSTEAYIARTEEGEICKISLLNANVSSCIDVGGRPVGLVLNSDKSKLFFVDPETKKVRRIITSTGVVLDLATLTDRPSALVVNKSGTQLFVTSDIANVVYRISAVGGSILSTINAPGGPDGIAVDNDGETLWISQSELGTVIRAGFVDVADQALDSLSNVQTITVGDHPAAMSLTSDGKFLLVSNVNDGTVSRINTQTLLVTHVMQVGAEPNAIAIDEVNNVAVIAYRFANSIGKASLPALPVPVAPAVDSSATPAVATPAVVPPPQAPVKTVIKAPLLTMKNSVTTKSIVTYSKLVVAKTSKLVVKIAPTSAKYCKTVGTSVKALKAGSCKVTVTVTPKKGKPISKTVTLKVAK